MSSQEKFVVKSRKPTGESLVVSSRLPVDLLRRLDEVTKNTGRTRNELVAMCIEYALDNLEIEK